MAAQGILNPLDRVQIPAGQPRKMNKELQDWCDRNKASMCAGTERKNAVIEFINKHWIILNPIAVLIYAHVLLAIIFALLGWEE